LGDYKILNIKGVVLDKNQLENYLAKLASDNILQNKSDKKTYPIPRLKDNFEYITNVYNILTEHLKLGIPIHPAGEWILDNYYIVEKTVKTIIKEMPLKKYVSFLGIENGNYKGFARIYVLASEIVAYTDAVIDRNNLANLLQAYQSKKNLSMDEIWNIGLFLQIALIENIRGICEKIYSSQMQKYKVENIIERLVENKESLKFKNMSSNKSVGYGEMKYPFIEYMSYRLKQYGKQAYAFLNILEEQVDKMGLSIAEVIQKEHFDIAVKKVSMGNSITSINTIIRVNFLEIFEQINGVEDILKQDPTGVYEKMDYKTRSYYRHEIEKIAKKTKISEMYIAKKCLELAKRYLNNNKEVEDSAKINNIEEMKKSHIGYYLISKGKSDLLSELLNKKIKKIDLKAKMNMYIYGVLFLDIILSSLCGLYVYRLSYNLIISILVSMVLLIPIQTIIVQLIQYILGKIVKPKLIPKLDFKTGIPEEETTMVIIPTIVKSAEKVKELFSKLEVYYIANKSENLYFTLLADCSSGKNEKEKYDESIIEAGIKEIERLNNKYPQQNFNKFNFIYRKRLWNDAEECYLGWERKRGLINQFNEYMLGNNKKSPFLYNSFEDIEDSRNYEYSKLPHIKYIITLDSDTDLVLNSGLELIGAMSHILNKPIIKNNVVVDGHALMQPRVGVGLLEVRRSLFTKIFSGLGGTDSYVNAIFDVYQDNFGEGIFTGKGIYDLNVFSQVLKNEIPENKVLSHDLLEGSYLRCGMVSDVMLMDGYPTNYIAFKKRLHRWIRGDYQILGWVINKKLNCLSKYKIIDNIFRSKLETGVLIAIFLTLLISSIYEINVLFIAVVALLGLIVPNILEIINKIVFRKDGEKRQKTFIKNYTTIKNSIVKILLSIGNIPDRAYMSCNAGVTSIYRMLISKKHLLEWVTAEEAEKNSGKDIKSYCFNMIPNFIISFIMLGLIILLDLSIILEIFMLSLTILWIVTPFIMYYISKPIKEIDKINLLNKNEQDYVLEIAQKIWLFFKENINEGTNYLPPDNYQEDRNPKIVKRTSSTNIGLGMLAVISSYDLKFENMENTIDLLEKMTNTVVSLQKWNGHLYNWYNLENLKPLLPRFVSTVDSGNFIGYLYVVLMFLNEIEQENIEQKYKDKVQIMEQQIKQIIENTDFTKIYDYKCNLFSIGFNVEENKLVDSYYDLLASEARQASLVAIAKKDIDVKNWFNLSRTLTVLNKYKGLISWSGTAFEYLMPNINIPKYPGSLLDESCKFMIMSQKEYAKKIGITWGISESAFNLKDLNNNYQYKAFGIPWLGLKRGLADERVVSTYGSVLAITEEPKEVLENLKVLESQGMYSKYGFYESIDYTPNRIQKNKKYENVKTYMAHHQGLILLSINNLFNKNILQTRFMKNPEMQAINILLEERMPENVIITKKKKKKVNKIKYSNCNYYYEKNINKLNSNIENYNLISNTDYSIIIDDKGNGYSRYKDILVNRYKPTSDLNEGIYFYIKNIRNKKIWSNGILQSTSEPDKYNVVFAPDKAKFTRLDGDIETTTKVTVSSNDNVEIRRIELKNLGNTDEILEVSSFLEPVLSNKEQDYAHPAFNNLFLSYEYIDELNTIVVKRKKRSNNQKEVYLAINLYSEENNVGESEYEISKEKFIGRNNFNIPKLVENSKAFSKKIELNTDSVIAMRKTVTIKAKDNVILDLIISVSEDRESVIENIKKYMNVEKNKRIFELSRARVEAENRYLEVSGEELELNQKLLGYLVGNNFNYNINFEREYPISELWKYGISGDLPIVFVKIKNVNDIDIIEELVKSYEYFKSKNLELDLVILNEEKENYDSFVREAINNVILNNNISYMLNIKGGIYVLNNISEEDKNIISVYSKVVFNAKDGNLAVQLKDFEDENIKVEKNRNSNIIILEDESYRENELVNYDLKYFNEYGGFSKDGKEYIIKVNKNHNCPMPWSHVLANNNMGTIVTESMGGYSWYKNSRLNRITSWANNAIIDVPSEVIYLKDEETQKAWSVGLNPMPDNNDYYVFYGFGYARFMHSSVRYKARS